MRAFNSRAVCAQRASLPVILHAPRDRSSPTKRPIAGRVTRSRCYRDRRGKLRWTNRWTNEQTNATLYRVTLHSRARLNGRNFVTGSLRPILAAPPGELRGSLSNPEERKEPHRSAEISSRLARNSDERNGAGGMDAGLQNP